MSVENALYHDERLAEVAAVGVPDEKLGELVAAVVSTKPAYHNQVQESELIDLARSRYFVSRTLSHQVLISVYRLPHFAVPVMIIIQDRPFGKIMLVQRYMDSADAHVSAELTPSAKIVKAPLRALARAEWERRKSGQSLARL